MEQRILFQAMYVAHVSQALFKNLKNFQISLLSPNDHTFDIQFSETVALKAMEEHKLNAVTEQDESMAEIEEQVADFKIETVDEEETTQRKSNFWTSAPYLKIGIIGFGDMGNRLLNGLFKYCNISKSQVTISTRRPEVYSNLINQGYNIIFDNELVIESHVSDLGCIDFSSSVHLHNSCKHSKN
jgi:hypothetical protein